jgi:hypothetical protein
MNKRIVLAAAVLAATASVPALAQQTSSPVAPRAGSSPVSLEGKVVVINSAKMMQNITEIRVKLDQINAKFDPRAKQLEQQKTQLEQIGNDIKSKQNVVEADAFAKLVADYKDREKNLTRFAQDLQDEFQREVKTVLEPLEKKVGDFRKGYAASRGIAVIFNAQGLDQSGALWYLADAVDITDDFVAEYNKANPVPGAAAAPARPGTGGK